MVFMYSVLLMILECLNYSTDANDADADETHQKYRERNRQHPHTVFQTVQQQPYNATSVERFDMTHLMPLL